MSYSLRARAALLVALAVAALRAVDADAQPAAPVLGTLRFPTSSAAHAAHAAFVTGVLYLHNFHYAEAARAFVQARTLDPGDVMATWGEAMTYTHAVWNQQDTAAARTALRALAPTRAERLAKARTPRERAWLDAVETLYAPEGGSKARRDTAYAEAMRGVHARYPDDESTTFYALALLGLNQGAREPVAYDRAYRLVAPVFRAHPQHPGAAHYLIHAVDDPPHAHLGLAAARAYGDIAPSAGHAMHMTSHIFVALGMWDDVVAANERAQRTARPGVAQPHTVQWLHYGLLQQGRVREADRWLDSMRRQALAVPIPLFRALSWDDYGLMSAANLSDTRRWAGPGAARPEIDPILGLDGGGSLADAAAAEFGIARAALGRGERAAFDSSLARMVARRTATSADPLLAGERGQSEVMEATLRALALAASGTAADSARAVTMLRDAAVHEAALPFAFGPPIVIAPPREVAGELLLAMHRPAEARTEFLAALARTPGRTGVLLGLARAERALGHRDAARARYRALATIWHAADADLPDLAEVRNGAR